MSNRAVNIATVAGAVVATIAFLFGVWQFYETQQLARENLRLQAETLAHERDTKAIELFIRFNELQKEVASKPLPRKGDAAFWHYNMMLSLTESVFRLTEGDAGWRETVKFMLDTQRPFLEGVPQGCGTFSQPFLELMKAAVPKLHCA